MDKSYHLLNDVLYLWGRQFGKGKKYGETTNGGRLIEEIKAHLKKQNAYETSRLKFLEESLSLAELYKKLEGDEEKKRYEQALKSRKKINEEDKEDDTFDTENALQKDDDDEETTNKSK